MTVVVLGMHRSGTSIVAGMLGRLGVHMGDILMGNSLHQRYGHIEDMDFVNLNKRILWEAGGSWCNPPPVERIAASIYQAKCEALVRRKSGRPMWGWKDPRTCLTIGLYHGALINPLYVLTERDRGDIAASLERREGPGLWGALVDQYEERVLQFLIDNEPTVLRVRFDDLLESPRREAAVLASYIDADESRIEDAARWVR